uniref:Uncharacterized protein n=1 Tax=Coccolithus braarudii TaxID=221442 RepID=A0A6T7JIY0_9EUKA|mmetsp:Transcript_48384/g.103247  ORF Transcript_48384/g.103247 Transcript_48384/m.103247 type:complete len:158 (+) Transcript_48384:72-545(+)|eukprot:CAMPEP_0183334250 /NCGR_PEP_ID=MMETSP0164_2-20130417/2909_1 /TAXON_ID=221442 /ORGANISM="Coccolithus pelagicus ssp braarudi, Strain PLY182g" /LENGTH=157 /DNA_ID=CAMNT_0025503355 /DNA_START=69 /DNA_END=542 /DNA_ORIENTATION=+
MALNVGLARGRRTVLHSAIERKDLKEVERLLGRGEDVDLSGGMYGETPLMYAIYKNGGWPAGVRLLIEKGADVNATLGMERTPLMIAGEFNRVEIAQDLIDAGADATLKYIDGRDAAAWALKYNHKEISSTLAAEAAKQTKLLRASQEEQKALLDRS